MPTQQGVLTNLDGLVFAKGFMYGTISGHAADAIAFGALQGVRLSHSFTFEDIYGPESLALLGRGVKTENLSGSWNNGVVSPEQLIQLIGGGQAYNAGTDTTTFTKYVNQEPLPFDLKINSDLNNPEMQIILYRCTSPGFNIALENRTWVMGDGSFDVAGEANGGRLFSVSKAGNQTNSS